ncbi:MAG: MraY family glycosyltransferase [Candidatus Moraniibacteriota bacterium]
MENLEIKNLLGFLLPLLVTAGVFLGLKKKVKTKRWGGVVLGLTIIIFLVIFQSIYTGFLLPKDFWSLTLGIIILLVGGLWDDLEKISWVKQLLFQSAAAIIAIFVGDTINHVRFPGGGVFFFPPFISAVLAYFWIVLVIEALNWLDGVDGVSGSVSLVTLIVLAALGLTAVVNQPSTTLLCLIIAGTLLGFLFFNFPPGKIYLGSSGIWILGFLIAVISIYSGGKVATTALVLGIPIIDFIFVSLERIFAGKLPVFGGDRLHLHERLLDQGWKPMKIVLVYSVFSILLGTGALLSQVRGKYFLFLPIAGFFLFFALVLGKSKARFQKK